MTRRILSPSILALFFLGAACTPAAVPTSTPLAPTATVISATAAPASTATPVAPTATAIVQPTATAPASENAAITVTDNRFTPFNQRVKAGGTVTWKYAGENSHTITDVVGGTGIDQRGKLFDLGPIHQSEQFSFRFTIAGTYSYVCKFHNSMTGTIVVE